MVNVIIAILQNIIIFFSLFGVGHFIRTLVNDFNKKDVYEIHVKRELAIVLLLVFVSIVITFSQYD